MEIKDPKNKQQGSKSEQDDDTQMPDRHYHHDDTESPHSLDELDDYDEHEIYTDFNEDDDQLDDD